jgi:iron complex transport system substrate-binding protein
MKKMMRFELWAAAALLTALLALPLSGCAKKDGGAAKTGGAEAVSIVTEAGGQEYTMTFDVPPRRAVSASGFTTEMMLALGLEKSMAGYAWPDNDVLPRFKAAYEGIPRLSDKYPSQEVLLAANPDFITGWKSAFLEKNFPPDFLEKNGVKFFVPYSEYSGTMDAVYKDFTTLGRIFRVEARAEEITGGMKTEIAALGKKIAGRKPVRVFVYDSGDEAPYTAGAALASELIRLSGGENVFAGEEKNWLKVQWEAVIEKNPQWIVVMSYSSSEDTGAKIAVLKSKEALQGIDAVKSQRWITMGLSDVTAGVRNTAAIERMARSFHPEAFK